MAGSQAQWIADSRSEPKLFALREYVFGFTTSFRMGDILRYHLALPPAPKVRLHRHMVVNVIPAIRACLKEGGFATTKDGAEVGGSFLVGVRSQLFEIATDYQVGRSAYRYASVGCGCVAAMGALAATETLKPRARVVAALLAAERHSIGVRRPWRFLTEP